MADTGCTRREGQGGPKWAEGLSLSWGRGAGLGVGRDDQSPGDTDGGRHF